MEKAIQAADTRRYTQIKAEVLIERPDGLPVCLRSLSDPAGLALFEEGRDALLRVGRE
jgi:hypothetical protein